MKIFGRKKRDAIERENMAQLERAEGDLRDLRSRAERAVGTLTSRDNRNHWRESIEKMITGAI